MRALTSYTSTEIDKPVTKPFYLVSMDFPTVLNLSNRQEVTIDGTDYLEYGFKVSKITPGKGGTLKGQIAFPNHDLVMGGLILTHGVKNRAITLYSIYGDGPWVADDLILLADGIMTGTSKIARTVVIDFIVGTAYATRAPRLMFSRPTFNHCPEPGTTLVWGEEAKTLEAPIELNITKY